MYKNLISINYIHMYVLVDKTNINFYVPVINIVV